MRNHLFLLRELVRRDFEGRYAGSLLGFFWSFVQPLWQLALFTIVFSLILRVPLVGERTEHFAVFLFCGLLPWMAVQEGVLRGTTAITDSAALVKKLSFPSEVLVVAVVSTAVLHEAIAAGVFVVVLAITGELAWGGLPILLLALPLQLALTLGLALILCSAQVIFRDTVQVLGLLLNAWFYLTPIVYPASLVPEVLRPWVQLNPLAALVGLYRSAFLGTPLGSFAGLGVLVAVATLSLVIGLAAFRRLKPTFADEI